MSRPGHLFDHRAEGQCLAARELDEARRGRVETRHLFDHRAEGQCLAARELDEARG